MRTHTLSPLLLPGMLTLLATPQAGLAQAAGSSIPATAATQSVSNLPSAQPATYSTQAGTPPDVKWNGALLSIRADGQSLPQILRAVARVTSMKITGSAPAQPVFGSYGPASVQQVMAALFDGLNVNMLLVNDTAVKPKELLLTARTGGASPPASPQQQDVSFDANQTNDPSDRNLIAPPHPGRHTSPDSFGGAPAQQSPGASFAPAVPLNDNSGNNGSSTSTGTDANGTPQSPNGVRTPEQIFEELRRRQQGATQ